MSFLQELGIGPATFALSLCAVFAAGLLRAFTGFGFALAAVPLLSLMMDPAKAIAISMAFEPINGVQFYPMIRREVDWPSLKLFVPAAFFGVPIGFFALTGFSPEALRIVIALALLLALGVVASNFRLPDPPHPAVTLGAGTLSGLLMGSTAMSGPPAIAYFLARHQPMARNRASMIAYFLVLSFYAVGAGLITGAVHWRDLALALLLCPPMLVANVIGQRRFNAATPQAYRMVALAVLSVMAAASVARAVIGG